MPTTTATHSQRFGNLLAVMAESLDIDLGDVLMLLATQGLEFAAKANQCKWQSDIAWAEYQDIAKRVGLSGDATPVPIDRSILDLAD